MNQRIKRCPKCSKEKPWDDFYWDSRRKGPSGWCKICHGANTKKHYVKNKAERLAYARNYWLKDQYGITQEQYEVLFAAQDGRCALCSVHDSELSKRLYVDHCHQTGKIRGLLCPKCNTALGILGDTAESLERVLSYMKGECLKKSL